MPCGITDSQANIINVALLPVLRNNGFIAQPLTWLMLVAMAMGKYLMNGYSIFKVRLSSGFTGDQRYIRCA